MVNELKKLQAKYQDTPEAKKKREEKEVTKKAIKSVFKAASLVAGFIFCVAITYLGWRDNRGLGMLLLVASFFLNLE